MKVVLTKEEAFAMLTQLLPKELIGGHEINTVSQSYSGDVEILLTKKEVPF